MDYTIKIALEEALEKRKKELKNAEIWLRQDMESLQAYRKTVQIKTGEINALKNQIADLTLALKG